MKKEQRLIIKLLDSLAKKYDGMSFKYGYNQSLAEHIVDVEPREKFDEEEYLIDEVNLIAAFIAKFPDKGLSFVSADPRIKVEDPIYQIKAKSDKSLHKRNAFPFKSFWGNLGRTLGF